MAYTPPVHWAHGDYPTATLFNRYRDDLNQIHSDIGDVLRNQAVLKITSGSSYCFVHRFRWLYFESAGKLADLNGGNAVSLSEGDGGGVTLYDLDQVSWLAYGGLYRVSGCSFAVESKEP